jgi:hypothetical protein
MNQPATTGLRAAGPFTSNQEGSFAWTVLAQRHPVLIEQVRRANPYGPRQLARLDALHEEVTSATITPLPQNAADLRPAPRGSPPRIPAWQPDPGYGSPQVVSRTQYADAYGIPGQRRRTRGCPGCDP